MTRRTRLDRTMMLGGAALLIVLVACASSSAVGPRRGGGAGWHGRTHQGQALGSRVASISRNRQECYGADGQVYYYATAWFYRPLDRGFEVAVPPPGAVVNGRPANARRLTQGKRSFWYYDGMFLADTSEDYVVIKPPRGAVVPYLPSGAYSFYDRGYRYYQWGNTTYQPYLRGGRTAYQVVR